MIGGRLLEVQLPARDLDVEQPNDESFTACLRRFVKRSGLSLSAIARGAWLDVAYISRLVNVYSDPRNEPAVKQGRKLQPSRDAVIRIGMALDVPIEDTDELLLSAGYAPLYRER